MIYVRRDPDLIPEEILLAAEQAQEELETLPMKERPDFIKKKAAVWRAFSAYLREMSYGKCWYSESPEAQSFFDVDHFRPKLSARRSDQDVDSGYEWLAFSWENFRLSASRSNRLSRDEDTGFIAGKGDWFPLLDGSNKASWNDRCESSELPILLDPISESDVRLIAVMDDGRMGPSRTCVGSARLRVQRSIEIYGLNLPRLKEARLRVIRAVTRLHEILERSLETAEGDIPDSVADKLPVDDLIAQLHEQIEPSSPFACAARCQLFRLPHGAEFMVLPEESQAISETSAAAVAED